MLKSSRSRSLCAVKVQDRSHGYGGQRAACGAPGTAGRYRCLGPLLHFSRACQGDWGVKDTEGLNIN